MPHDCHRDPVTVNPVIIDKLEACSLFQMRIITLRLLTYKALEVEVVNTVDSVSGCGLNEARLRRKNGRTVELIAFWK